jgi:hypothetical protein
VANDHLPGGVPPHPLANQAAKIGAGAAGLGVGGTLCYTLLGKVDIVGLFNSDPVSAITVLVTVTLTLLLVSYGTLPVAVLEAIRPVFRAALYVMLAILALCAISLVWRGHQTFRVRVTLNPQILDIEQALQTDDKNPIQLNGTIEQSQGNDLALPETGVSKDFVRFADGQNVHIRIGDRLVELIRNHTVSAVTKVVCLDPARCAKLKTPDLPPGG